MKENFYVYILSSQKNGTLYIGVASNLIQRVYQHKEGQVDGFTKKYGVKTLVYYEIHQTADPQSCVKNKSKSGKETGSLS